jgi:hypothetical protein
MIEDLILESRTLLVTNLKYDLGIEEHHGGLQLIYQLHTNCGKGTIKVIALVDLVGKLQGSCKKCPIRKSTLRLC